MKMKSIAAFALAALLVSPAIAQDEAKTKKKDKKGNASPAMQLIKQLEPVGLTDEQVDKIKEMAKTSMDDLAKVKEEAGITPELMKKVNAAQKEVRGSGVKGKEVMVAVHEKAGLSEAQIAAFKEINASRAKFHKSVYAMLTEEQKAKVPEKMQRMLNGGGKKGGAKKGGAKKGGEKKKKKAA